MSAWSEFDQHAMDRALALAAQGLYSTDPNPRVGSVLAQADRIVGEGWHERAGEPHAEVLALRAAGDRARGATVYVTLEPCAHHGRTPPCVEALIKAQVARVVYAIDDPDPRVAGGGAAQLRAAGIAVESGLRATEAETLNPGFLKRMRQGLPWVRVKLGASLDGRTALANGASQWITGTAARTDAQRYRARSSVLLTGIGTVLADDPRLDVRLPGAVRQPMRAVVDSRLRAPAAARLFAPTAARVVFTADPAALARRAALEQRGVQVETLAADAHGQVPLRAMLQRLAARGANEVMVEAGAGLSGALLAAGLVDELLLYLAPCLLGSDARALLTLPRLGSLDDRWSLRFAAMTQVGEDIAVRAYVQARM